MINGDDLPYVLDVDYPSQFIHQQTPVMLSYVAALNRFNPPDPNIPYNYCELGCGTGETLNVLAAANPYADFIGIDLNSSHIAQCEQVAADSGIRNVRYINASFDELENYELHEFDFITTHGTYSWLPPSAINSITAFLSAHLRPNGLFYVEYLTLPGKAAIQPVWQLMRELTAGQGMGAAQRAAEGLDALLRISAADGQFFKKNQPAERVIRTWDKRRNENPQRIFQLAHQALAAHWKPRYITEVAEELGKAGVRYAGTTQLPYNDFEICVRESQRPVFEGVQNYLQIELLKDYIHNRHGRADVFIKSSSQNPVDAKDFLQKKICFIPLAGPTTEALHIQRPDGSRVNLDGQIYPSLIKAIYEGNHRLFRIQQLNELAGTDWEETIRAVSRLVIAGICTVSCNEPDYKCAGTKSVSSFRISSSFNRNQSTRNHSSQLDVAFASPVMGGSTKLIKPLLAWLLQYALEQDIKQAAGQAWQASRNNSTLVQVGRNKIPKSSLTEMQLLALIQEIRSNLVPYMLLMGVLEPGTPNEK